MFLELVIVVLGVLMVTGVWTSLTASMAVWVGGAGSGVTGGFNGGGAGGSDQYQSCNDGLNHRFDRDKKPLGAEGPTNSLYLLGHPSGTAPLAL